MTCPRPPFTLPHRCFWRKDPNTVHNASFKEHLKFGPLKRTGLVQLPSIALLQRDAQTAPGWDTGLHWQERLSILAGMGREGRCAPRRAAEICPVWFRVRRRASKVSACRYPRASRAHLWRTSTYSIYLLWQARRRVWRVVWWPLWLELLRSDLHPLSTTVLKNRSGSGCRVCSISIRVFAWVSRSLVVGLTWRISKPRRRRLPTESPTSWTDIKSGLRAHCGQLVWRLWSVPVGKEWKASPYLWSQGFLVA